MSHKPTRRRSLARTTASPWILPGVIFGVLTVASAPARAADSTASIQAQRQYDIPAGPLDRALKTFASQAGVMLSVDAALTEAKTTRGLKGSYAVAPGFEALLAGSGLAASQVDPGSYSVRALPPNDSGSGGDVRARPLPQTKMAPIVITAAGHAQEVEHAAATVTVIEGEEINSKPYASVIDALRDVPGVVVSGGTTAFGRSGNLNISIRGLSDTYVLMLVNGRPIGNSTEATYDGFGSGIQAGYLPPPSAVERIEVIRGPMSSLYGSAALGGVINVITKPVSGVWTGTLTGGSTAYDSDDDGNSYEGRFSVAGPLIRDKLGMTLYGSLHDRSNHQLLSDRSIQDVRRDSLGSKLDWMITENQDVAVEVVRSTQTNESTGIGGGFDIENTNYSLSHGLMWGEGFETNSYVNYEDDEFLRTNLPSGYSQLNLNSRTRFVLGQHDLTMGADYREEETRHSRSRVPAGIDPNMTRWNAALFGENNWRLLDNFTATLGLRYDENERYGSHVTPRVYGVWDVSKSLVLKGGVSTGFKVPALKQADDNIIETALRGRGWDAGNTDLKPEESTNYEVGALWRNDLRMQLGLTVYHTRFTDRIDRETICSDPVGRTCMGREYVAQYVNRDEAELTGVEATFGVPLSEVDVSFNYTFADSEITKGVGAGNRFNNLPEHVANLGLEWDATEALNVWGKAQYRSETFDTDNARVPDHVVTDIGVGYDFNAHVQANVGVYNVSDKTFTNDYMDGRRYYVLMTSRF